MRRAQACRLIVRLGSLARLDRTSLGRQTSLAHASFLLCLVCDPNSKPRSTTASL